MVCSVAAAEAASGEHSGVDKGVYGRNSHAGDVPMLRNRKI